MARYDLNVWDKAGYESEYEISGWVIDIYECDENWTHFADPEKRIWLNQLNTDMLTLGVASEDGGDYDYDYDFWIDPQAFLTTYTNIPRKVRRYLEEYV